MSKSYRSNDMRTKTLGQPFIPFKNRPKGENPDSHYFMFIKQIRNSHVRYRWIRILILFRIPHFGIRISKHHRSIHHENVTSILRSCLMKLASDVRLVKTRRVSGIGCSFVFRRFRHFGRNDSHILVIPDLFRNLLNSKDGFCTKEIPVFHFAPT